MAQLSHANILKQGRWPAPQLQGTDQATVMRLYRFMLRLRRIEQALIKEYHPADEMRCPSHFCVGQEAIPSALSLELQTEDYLFSHHRSHGYFLAKAAPLNALFAELYGKSTGANGGIAGSQDISFGKVNFHSGAILAGAIGIAVGAAMAFQLRQQPQVVVAGFGEGATDEGLFWESISLASQRKLPIVFVCENNAYATHSHLLKRQPADNLSERVSTFGLQTYTVFGNDAVTSHAAVADGIKHARAGRGACFVEAYTYRWNGHVGPQDEEYLGYRPPEELEQWKANCPLTLIEESLRKAGWLTDTERESLAREIDAEIAEAFVFAKSSPFPGTTDFERLNRSLGSPLADRCLVEIEPEVFNQNQRLTIPAPY